MMDSSPEWAEDVLILKKLMALQNLLECCGQPLWHEHPLKSKFESPKSILDYQNQSAF